MISWLFFFVERGLTLLFLVTVLCLCLGGKKVIGKRGSGGSRLQRARVFPCLISVTGVEWY